jgi:hypothetical protein
MRCVVTKVGGIQGANDVAPKAPKIVFKARREQWRRLCTSVTYAAEQLAAEVIRSRRLPTPLVWIEHWPKETTEGQETFELVVFSSYEVVERASYLGETRAWIGNATWKRLDRATVEVLVGETTP